MSLFISGLSLPSNKEGKTAMLIGNIYITRLMILGKHIKEYKLRYRRELYNKMDKKIGSKYGQKKGNLNRSSFQERPI